MYTIVYVHSIDTFFFVTYIVKQFRMKLYTYRCTCGCIFFKSRLLKKLERDRHK